MMTQMIVKNGLLSPFISIASTALPKPLRDQLVVRSIVG